MAHPFRLFFLFALLMFARCSFISAQNPDNPRVYINSVGERFTEMQFDSIKKANMGKPIAMKDVVKKNNVTEVTFEILVVHPDDAIRSKWINKPLPSFSLMDIAGKQVSNESLRGKISVLNFWSTTCAPCIQEMPHLSELKSRYVEKNVTFLAFSPENSEKIKHAVAKRNFTYTLVPDAQQLFNLLGLEGYPFHFVVNETGIVKAIYSGSRVNTGTNQVELDSRLVEAIDKVITTK